MVLVGSFKVSASPTSASGSDFSPLGFPAALRRLRQVESRGINRDLAAALSFELGARGRYVLDNKARACAAASLSFVWGSASRIIHYS